MMIPESTRRGRQAYPRERARMTIVNRGRYFYYFGSVGATEAISEWPFGALIAWETDSNGRPHTMHLKPALDGGGRRLRKYNGDRPYLSIPTSAIGLAVGPRSQFVEEIEISPNAILVRLPFEFRPR